MKKRTANFLILFGALLPLVAKRGSENKPSILLFIYSSKTERGTKEVIDFLNSTGLKYQIAKVNHPGNLQLLESYRRDPDSKFFDQDTKSIKFRSQGKFVDSLRAPTPSMPFAIINGVQVGGHANPQVIISYIKRNIL